ncbi:hypothetical protein ACF0H5_010753 [Mactra antiquata]
MVNLLYTQTKDGFIIAIDTDRLQSGMASENGGDSMAPDEMYLMLQADMVSIKQQEQVLQTEIEEIASKFHQLLDTCGIDSDTGSGTLAPPSTPSFMKTTTASLTQVSKLETPTFLKQTPSGMMTTCTLSDSSDDDGDSRTMFPDVIDAVVNKTDGLPLDVSVLSPKSMVVDRNSNYLDSPHSDINDNNTPVIEALPCLEKTSSSMSTNTTSSSSGSSQRMSSSDGYPKSDDSTDNQIVPECYDLDKEFMSRLQYYSDFTFDRQRKINSMVSGFGYSVQDNSPCTVTEDILTRHVEGKESSPEKPAFVRPVVPPPSTSSGSDYVSTPTSHHQRTRKEQKRRYSKSGRKRSSQPLASSTMLDESFSSSGSSRSSRRAGSLIPKASSTMIFESESSSGSSRRNRTSGSNPRACSTMLNESFLSSGSTGSGGSRHRSSSIPLANSTVIHDGPIIIPSCGEPTISRIHHENDTNIQSDNDCESVYTWSIHDGDSGSERDLSLEESYMRKVTKGHMNNNKPPLPPSKRIRSDSISSRDSDCEIKCEDHQLHKLLGEPCSKTIIESMSIIEHSDTVRDGNLFVESLCDETLASALPKSNTIPRSSTRVKLQDKSSGSSSLEARRASLPDLTSVGNNYDDPSAQNSSSCVSEDDITELSERPDVQGKSSSSNDNPNTGASQGSANVDSILTDSPNSVCSSGINAPYNSPGTNTSNSSRVSCSTTSDARSSDSNINTRAPQVTLVPRNIQASVNSPKVQNIDMKQKNEGAVFKVPKQNQPLRNLFRFRRKSKTPEIKTSTPKDSNRDAHRQPQSKRQLFPSSGSTNLHEAKVMDKKAVIRKFKKFSDSFRARDRAGQPDIQTLANL